MAIGGLGHVVDANAAIEAPDRGLPSRRPCDASSRHVHLQRAFALQRTRRVERDGGGRRMSELVRSRPGRVIDGSPGPGPSFQRNRSVNVSQASGGKTTRHLAIALRVVVVLFDTSTMRGRPLVASTWVSVFDVVVRVGAVPGDGAAASRQHRCVCVQTAAGAEGVSKCVLLHKPVRCREALLTHFGIRVTCVDSLLSSVLALGPACRPAAAAAAESSAAAKWHAGGPPTLEATRALASAHG